MNISIALPAMAPQPTGHPASLPEDPAGPDVTQKVAEAQTSADSQGAQTGTQSNTGEKQSAPPSAMQLKIMQILEQQAKEMDRAAEQ